MRTQNGESEEREPSSLDEENPDGKQQQVHEIEVLHSRQECLPVRESYRWPLIVVKSRYRKFR